MQNGQKITPTKLFLSHSYFPVPPLTLFEAGGEKYNFYEIHQDIQNEDDTRL